MFSIFKAKNNEVVRDYETILSASRNETLYTKYNVPDTPQGRFQMIALHAAPYFGVYADRKQGPRAQKLFDMIFRDIELSFREIGVGDLAVPKKMKRYMQDFNGLMQLHAAADADHVDITRRNVFGEEGELPSDFEIYIKGIFDHGH